MSAAAAVAAVVVGGDVAVVVERAAFAAAVAAESEGRIVGYHDVRNQVVLDCTLPKSYGNADEVLQRRICIAE